MKALSGTFFKKICFQGLFFFGLFSLCGISLQAQAAAANSGITYTGRILDSAGAPVVDPSVIFTVTVYDSAGKCWLYTEQRNLDLSLTAGTFSFEIGSNDPTTVYGAPLVFNNSGSGGPNDLADLFSNSKAFVGLGTANGCTGSYDPSTASDPNEGRLLSVYFKIGAMGANQALPPMRITPVPMAMQALAVNGYGTGDLLKVAKAVDKTANANSDLSQTQYDEFWRLLKNPLAAYLPVSGDVTLVSGNNKVTTLLGQALPAGPATNGQVLVSNGTAWVLQSMGTGSVTSVSGTAPVVVGGTATAPVVSLPAATTSASGYLTSMDWNTFNSKLSSSLASGKILVGNASGLATEVSVSGDATMDNAGVVTLKNTGTAGTYGSATLVPVVTTDAQGRVTGITTAAPLDATKLPLAGGTMSGALNMGGFDITNTGNISMAASKTLGLSSNAADPGSPTSGQVWYNSTSNVIKYYDGTAIQALGVAGAGITSLNGITSGTQTFAIGISGNSPGFSSATSTHTLNIPLASTAAVTAGLISKADYDNFTSKLGAVSDTASLTAGKVWIGNASNAANEQTLSGDATITNAGVVTVDKTQTAAASKILQLTASSVAVTKGTDIGGAGAGVAHLLYPNTATDTTLTFPNSAGSSSQFLQTDGSGNLSWSTALTGSTGFINGGNSFGANSSLGNNDNFNLDLKTNNTSRMTILYDGNVGIGTNAPSARLTIGNNVATGFLDTYAKYQEILYDSGNAATSYGLGIKGATMVFNSGGGAYSFDAGGTATKMVIDTSGNVGVGTTAPGSKLDVQGTLRLSGATSGYVGFAPAAAAGSTTYTLPTTQGTAGQVLSTDGVAATPTLSWITPSPLLPGLASTQVWVGNASGAATAVSLSGDITGITNAGVVTTNKTITAEANKLLSLNGSGVATSMGNQLNGLTSGSLTLQADAVTTNYSLTFPAAQGGAGQTLSNNGAGVLSWITPLTSSTGFINGGNSFGANSSLGNNDNFNLDLKTNNITRMTILNSGNIGIGIGTPLEKFHIYSNTIGGAKTVIASDGTVAGQESAINLLSKSNGTDNIGAATSKGWEIHTKSDAHGSVNLKNALDFAYWNGTSWNDAMIIDSTGKVGIGTLTPGNQLHLSRAAGTDSGVRFDSGTVQGEAFSSSGSTKVGFGSLSNHGVSLFTNDTDRVRISATGDVGIGTPNPSSILHISRPGSPVIKLQDSTNLNTANSFAGWISGQDSAGSESWWVGEGSETGKKVGLTAVAAGYDVALTNAAGQILLDSAGNVGIGTSSPRSQLEIAAASNPLLFVSDGGGATANEIFMRLNTGVPNFGEIGAYHEGTGPLDLILQKTAGNVGIGTAAPDYTLHVVGTAGLSSGTAWTNASDLRLKDVRGDYEYGLDEVLQLHTIRYNYKKDNPLGLPSDNIKTGFIAQEVQKVIPEAVNIRKDGYLELNVDPIHWAVVNAIKDLYQKCILALQEHVQKLDQEVDSVKDRTTRLEEEAAIKDKKIQELQQENDAIKAYLCAQNPSAVFCK